MGRLILFIVGMGFLACSHRPVEEMTVADLALKAAQKSKADVLASETYRRAENYYLKAKKDYNEGYFDSAVKFANQARQFAEQSEFQAAVKQVQTKLKAASPSEPTPSAPPAPPPTGPTTESLE